ncbi:MAG: hypothetical protein ACRDKL_08370 [Solirubrobacteraceae bacterium]
MANGMSARRAVRVERRPSAEFMLAAIRIPVAALAAHGYRRCTRSRGRLGAFLLAYLLVYLAGGAIALLVLASLLTYSGE